MGVGVAVSSTAMVAARPPLTAFATPPTSSSAPTTEPAMIHPFALPLRPDCTVGVFANAGAIGAVNEGGAEGRIFVGWEMYGVMVGYCAVGSWLVEAASGAVATAGAVCPVHAVPSQ